MSDELRIPPRGEITSDAVHGFCDGTTRVLIGVPALMARLAPDSALCRRESSVGLRMSHEEWAEFWGRLNAVERWSHDADRLNRVRGHLRELPDLRSLLSQLVDADWVGIEGDFFALKRFGFHAMQALAELEPLQRVCRRQAEGLRIFLQAIHPEETPSARFLVSDTNDPELAEARAALKRARRHVSNLRKDLESGLLGLGLRFDIHGRGQAGPDFQGAAGLTRSGDSWVLDSKELRDAEVALNGAQSRNDECLAKVLQAISSRVFSTRAALEEAQAFLSVLDFDLAKLRLRDEIGGSFPRWAEETKIHDGYAIDIESPQRVDISMTELMVVTGPNMGGKSALLRLVGLCHWCLRHGMPAPARECEVRPFDHVVYVGADADEAIRGLSSFGREVRRLVSWWGASNTLWLFDELGRGTHPEEGATIAKEVVEARVQMGDHVLIATHFPDVVNIPGAHCMRIAGITDPAALEKAAAGELDVEVALRAAMDYRLVPGDDVPRDARLVARALGLPLKESK
jgi:DNA mismatch repair ATPase MutS